MPDFRLLRSVLGGPVLADLRRTPLRRVSKKKAAANRRLARLAELVSLRAHGGCEACQVHHLPACPGRGSHAHHVVRRSQGGRDEASNLLWVSAAHHAHIHAHPSESFALGLLRRQVVVPFRGDAA